MAQNQISYTIKGSAILCGIILCLYTNILLVIFLIAIWLLVNIIGIYYLSIDAIKYARTFNQMIDKVQLDQKKLGVFFYFKELVKPQVGTVRQEGVKFLYVFVQAINRSSAFVFFSTTLALINGKTILDSAYCDLFCLSGAIIINPGGKTLLFIGAYNR